MCLYSLFFFFFVFFLFYDKDILLSKYVSFSSLNKISSFIEKNCFSKIINHSIKYPTYPEK